MLAGDFASAWKESDEISGRANPDPHRFWDGKPIHGRHVLIRSLHGLGDTLQFIRYAPLIRELSKSLTIEVQPSLKSLIAGSHLADRVITWGEPEPPWDQQIEVVELPRVFRTEIHTIPSHVPYLCSFPNGGGRALRSGKFKVGLVWKSSNFNPQRSLEAGQAAQLLGVKGSEFFSLQAGPERHDMHPWRSLITDLQSDDPCVTTTASVVSELDLVITVDTMMAHLAGALARPVWTLLPYQCDWRWMLDRNDSPWYPTMRLFRQTTPGNWNDVVERVRMELETLLGTKARRQSQVLVRALQAE
jgi:hypothetical protein